MTSITYAMKAKTVLNSKGIRCDIIRTPKNISSGCGYSIRVFGDKNDILQILKQNGVKWKEWDE